MAGSGHPQMAYPLDAARVRAMVDLSQYHTAMGGQDRDWVIGRQLPTTEAGHALARHLRAPTIGVNDDKCCLLLRMSLFLRRC